ncbi:MAG: Flp family type IVb pilin [bacterium]|nr:Flp family type IVb pilin [bacterium]
MTNILKTLIPDEEAATALEYALLLFLIAGVIIGAVSVFGVSVGDLFKTAGAAIGAVMG